MTFGYIIIFFLFSILGGIMDTTYRSYIGKKFSSGCFMGVLFCPIYGLGTIVMVQLVSILLEIHIVFRLLFYMGSLTILEYVGSLFCEKILHKKLWDYSDLPLNFQGRVNLQHSIYWLLLAVVFEYFYPVLIVPVLNYQFFNAEYDLLFSFAFSIIFILIFLLKLKESKKVKRKIIRH